MGRFINADAFPSTGQGIIGNNMYAYCNNSPVYLADYNGESATVAGAIIGGIFGFFNGILGGGSAEEVLACTISGAVTGAMAGFVADVACASFGVGGAILASAFAGGVCNATNSAVTQSVLNNGVIDANKVASDFVFGAVCGGLCTSVSSLSAFRSLGLKEGLRYVSCMLMAEETIIVTQPVIASVSYLGFDVAATAVTCCASFVAGLAYDYYS